MGTVSCPVCRKEVSFQANTCPKCGHPIRKNVKFILFDKRINNIFLAIIFLAILFILLNCGGSSDKKQGETKQDMQSSPQMENDVIKYYELMNGNPNNKEYRKSFDRLNHEYISKYGKFKNQHSLVVEGFGESVNLKPKPGDTGETVVARIPDKTALKIADMEIIKLGMWDALFFKVKYKNKEGWIPEVYTNRAPDGGIKGRRFN